MKIVQKSLVLQEDLYYRKHLEIVNTVLPIQLTPKEIEVLASFMAIEGELVAEDRFNSIVRKKVMEKTKIVPGGLGNYLNSMIKKGFLNKHPITKKITIKPFLIPETTSQGYQFKIKKENENKNN